MRLGRALIPCGLLATSVTPLVAQNACGVDWADVYRAVAQGTPSETHFLTRATISCEDGTEIYADSAIISPPQRLSQFFGNVSFTEQGRVLLSDRATYRSDIDRLDAFGDVSLVDTAGSELTGDNLVYIRDGENRENAHLTMTGLGGVQPRALIIPGQSSSGQAEEGPAASTSDSTALVGDSAVGDSAVVDATEPDTEVADTVAVDAIPGDLAPVDSAGAADSVQVLPPEPPIPYEVTADRIIIEGSDAFRGEGRVEVTRETLHATGRNMVYDAARGELLMVGDAQSEGDGYDLEAEAITVVLPQDVVEAVVARGDAILTTDDLDLTAPKIHIFVDAEKLQRLVAAQLNAEDRIATGAGSTPAAATPSAGGEGADTRATALTQDFILVGDSLDVYTPAEQLERVVAVGRARGESFSADSLVAADTPELARNDWLEGDTIVATFVPATTAAVDDIPVPQTIDSVAAVPDSTNPLAGFQAQPSLQPEPAPTARERYDLDRLVATGNARSLYRMAPSDTTGTVEPGRVALHYVMGEGITIAMVDGEVDRMEVSGQTQGFHLEPVALAPAPDTLAADTSGVDSLPVSDSAGIAPDSVPPLTPDTALPPDTVSRQVPGSQRGRSGRSGVPEAASHEQPAHARPDQVPPGDCFG